MTEDIVRELGHLALGSRLKRLGERLQAQAQELLEAEGMSLSASHCPLLAALDRLGPLSVGEIAAALGVRQPGVTRLLERLESEGLVKSQLAADRRRRPIMLSRAGRQLVLRGKRSAWARIEAAVAEACQGLRGSFLGQVTELEDALETASLADRAARRTAAGKRHAGA